MKTLLESGPKHCIGSPPSTRSVLMRSDYCPIDDGANLVELELQLLEDELPNAPVRPVGEPVVDRLPRSEALRQIPPRHTGLRAKQHRVDELAVANLRSGPLSALRQKRSQPVPLFVGQSVSMHRKLGSHSGAERNFSANLGTAPRQCLQNRDGSRMRSINPGWVLFEPVG